jgi:type I site-specific restriction endonuclease
MGERDKYPVLALPPAELKIERRGGGLAVRCLCRGKYVALTPEEWVRQHFISYLSKWCGYPAGLIAVEVALEVNGVRRRADVVCYDKKLRPLVVVECKAPEVQIVRGTLDQARMYHTRLNTPVVVLTNGLIHYCYVRNEAGEYEAAKEMPKYEEVVAREK